MHKPVNQDQPYALKAGEGWTYRYDVDFTVKSGEIRAGGSAAFLEFITNKGEEPPSHTHPTEDEMFYVVEGALTFHCGEQTFDLEKGGFIFLPKGIQHSYTIHSQDPVQLIVVTSHSTGELAVGWGGFVAELESNQSKLVSEPPHVS